MNIIFLGTIGVYHPTVAAHMYLSGQITTEFGQMCYWGDFQSESLGEPLLIGYDSGGNRVYSLGAGIDIDMTRRSIEQLTNILGHDQNELMIQPISVHAEKTILKLYRLAQIRLLQKPINWLVGYVLAMDVDTIHQQVKECKDRVGFD